VGGEVRGSGAASLSFTARIERAHSDRARSASKKDGWLFPMKDGVVDRSSGIDARSWDHLNRFK
jgi:hypothetical protein